MPLTRILHFLFFLVGDTAAVKIVRERETEREKMVQRLSKTGKKNSVVTLGDIADVPEPSVRY